MPMLFDPFDLHGLTLPNRLVMAPMTRTRATEDGVPTELMHEYYSQRASAGLIISKCIQVSDQGHGIIRAPGLHRQDQLDGWRRVTDAVHAAGGRIYGQLWHAGRSAHPDIRGGVSPVAPSAIAAEGQLYLPTGPAAYPVPRVLERAEIPGIIEDFRQAAQHAQNAGFDGVELHGAFGYLPDQFLQSGSNARTDDYGGSVNNRARFLLEVTEALIGVWGPQRVGVKLSPSNRQTGMVDADPLVTFGYVIQALSGLGTGYLHLMEPNERDFSVGAVPIKQVAETFRPLSAVPLIANGGFDKAKGNAVLAAGTADLVSFGVPFLANPDLSTAHLTSR
jgi:N-ethylmaleimide reductase